MKPFSGDATTKATRTLTKKLLFALTLLLLIGALASCRNETQNRIRRDIQDFTGGRMYITLYGLDGTPIYSGTVDGKVTRASGNLANSNENAAGGYVFWFDENGQYHQSDLPYLVTSNQRDTGSAAPQNEGQ